MWDNIRSAFICRFIFEGTLLPSTSGVVLFVLFLNLPSLASTFSQFLFLQVFLLVIRAPLLSSSSSSLFSHNRLFLCLFSVLQHPLTTRGCKRETHALDWKWDTKLDKASKTLQVLYGDKDIIQSVVMAIEKQLYVLPC